ncbi:hypothetical protein [Microbacterium schleiferi]|uniref:hypothetical protein n=1 Tax=Microbacterium schleiferi TaxID=69362 RepID=UPI000B291E9F
MVAVLVEALDPDDEPELDDELELSDFDPESFEPDSFDPEPPESLPPLPARESVR